MQAVPAPRRPSVLARRAARLPLHVPSAWARAARLGLAFTLTALVAGCGMMKGFGSSSGAAEAPSSAAPGATGAEAQFRPVAGSAVTGSVRFARRSEGVAMSVQLHGTPGMQYRVAVHANGNCTSPNAFSAGPPWFPAGSATAPEPRPFTLNTEGNGNLTVRLPAYTLEGPNGLIGKSVVVHAGSRGSLEARPDVPNERVACGVIGPFQPLF